MYHFVVVFIDEYDKIQKKISGLVGATSYNTAVERIAQYYGEESIISIQITSWEEILTEEEIIEEFAHEVEKD